NEKWCTDFTYIYLLNNDVRYNCTVIDLYDRSVVSSVCGKRMDTGLAKRALNKAFKDNPRANKEIILHSDQGSQFTSKEFVKYCEEQGIIQSMSKVGCPYDNAVMERYYNTLKEEYLNNYIFEKEEDLYKGIEEFSYVYYNYVRPHSYNGYLTPMEVRRRK
ncbi:IS3 family transposase, partial [Streptobacillus felis]|uniref:IS3 family transposase n=1 Tax=Streptobacillus felis TaxID=1384509 RepID=UPI0008368F55